MSDDSFNIQPNTFSNSDSQDNSNQRQKIQSTLPTASESDSPFNTRSRSDNRPGIDSTHQERIKTASSSKTQSDLLKRLQAPNRGPSGVQPKWKNVTDPLKPQPIRSYEKLDPIPHIPHVPRVNNDLTSSLFSRLHTVETLNKQLQTLIQVKNNEITRMQSIIDANSTNKCKEQMKNLEIINSNLEKKIKDMEKWFLRHGMMWQDSDVGFDIKGFMNGISKLNETVGSKPYAFLAIYKNGYIIEENHFTLWTEQKGIQFLQEVVQGKPPNETLKDYPQGVRFDVFDRHEQDFVDPEYAKEDSESGSFSDPENSESFNNITAWNPLMAQKSAKVFSKIGTLNYKPKQSLDTFMTKFIPKYTIRGGRVIQVREGLTDLINGTEGKITISTINPDLKPGISKIANLRIRVNNHTEYVIKADASWKISDLKKMLAKNDNTLNDLSMWDLKLPIGLTSKYKIGDNKTLFECNLVPSARLFITYQSGKGI